MSLLEDNNTLRNHNDNLIYSLEKNNEDFQEVCLEIDHLKLSGMIKTLSKLAEYSLYGAFSRLSFRL